MRHLCITYHMVKQSEIAESCITIPMMAEVASDIMENQEESQYVRQGSFSDFSITPIKTILNQLAELQGYQSASFTCAHDYDNRNG